MEDYKKKKSTGFIVTVVILSLVIFFLILFICLDKFVFTSSKKDNKKQEIKVVEKEPEKEKIVESKEISIAEISEMKKLAELVFQETNKLEFKDLTNQAKLNIAISLTGKSLDEIKLAMEVICLAVKIEMAK